MGEEMIFQEIYEKIKIYLPKKWNKIVFYAEYGDGVYQMEFFVKDMQGTYKKCFELPGSDMNGLLAAFKEIDRQLKPFREKFGNGQQWTSITLEIEEDGKFGTHYDYTNLSECGYEHKNEWKKKYLV